MSCSLSSTTPTTAIAVSVSSDFAISERMTLLSISSRSKKEAEMGRTGLALLNRLVERAQSFAAQFMKGTDSRVLSRIVGLDAGSSDWSPRTS